MSKWKENTKYRMSGVLMHPTSLHTEFGIGDLGPSARAFVDFLQRAHQTLWQVLPIGPTGYGDSPYQSYSSFAGQVLLISPEELVREGLLQEEDLFKRPFAKASQVDYGRVIPYKEELFLLAYKNFLGVKKDSKLISDYHYFLYEHGWWLEEFTLYCAIKKKEGGKSWLDWEKSHREYRPRDEFQKDQDYYAFLQFMFYRQWFRLKDYANERGIYLVGDLPIFVALDGADVWAHKELYQLDEKGFPRALAGVPPDYFSKTGQLWGNPLYNWAKMKEDEYDWWKKRIGHQLHLLDYLRIDHFRGFEAYWSVPAKAKTAIPGHWEKGPDHDFFYEIEKHFGGGLPIFAEDLGVITPEVERLRDDFGFPGMKVLQFAFEGMGDSGFLPHHFDKNTICYTGTHDNNTTLGWYKGLSREQQAFTKKYLHSDKKDISWAMIELALSSVSRYAIIPVWDLLSFDERGRMNTPGEPAGNWKLLLKKGLLDEKLADKLRDLTDLYAR